MDGLVLDLLLGGAHEVADAHLGVLGPVGLDVGELEVEQLAVEAREEGQQEVLLALQPEVAVGEVEGPRPGARLREHEEVLGARDEPQHAQSAQEDQRLPAREAEVLVVRRDRFGAAQLGLRLEGLSHAGDDALVGVVIGVDVGAEGGALEGLALARAARHPLLELLDVGCVALAELGEGLLRH